MRRRVEATEGLEAPRSLLRFRPDEWLDGSECPPPHWPVSDRGMWLRLQAFKRQIAARREWRREHGISWDDSRKILKGQ